MSWFTVEDAAQLGPSEDTWWDRIDAEEVSSYEDEWGRTWVWVEPAQSNVDPWKLEEDMLPMWQEVASLRREVVRLRRTNERASEQEPETFFLPEPDVEPEPVVELEPEPVVAFEPSIPEPTLAIVLEDTPSPAAGDAERILDLYRRAWSGSDRQLEREAGLPKAFLAKAKKGLRNGPKSAATWERLEAYLRSLSPATTIDVAISGANLRAA